MDIYEMITQKVLDRIEERQLEKKGASCAFGEHQKKNGGRFS